MAEPTPGELQDIVAALQSEIRQQRIAQNQPTAPTMDDPLANVMARQKVETHLPIGWPVMPSGLVAKLRVYVQKAVRRLLRWYINPLFDQQNAYNAAATQALVNLFRQTQSMNDNLRELQQTRDAWIHGLEAHVKYLQQMEEDRAATVDLRLLRLENWRHAAAPQPETPVAAPPPPPVRMDYFLLGALYRSEKQAQIWVTEYDDVFLTLLADQQQGRLPAGPVLDIGCGRGELIAHLQDIGLQAYGIDIDTDAVQMGQAKGRDVREADVFAHLAELSDHSLAAVTLMQVVEHFDFDTLLRMLELIARKLLPGGFVLAETINPVCLWAAHNWYLLDPSHQELVHPQMLRFLMEQAGLGRVQIRLMHPANGNQLKRLELTDRSPEWRMIIETINDDIDRLNDFLYGNQDYAAIGYRLSE